MHSDIAAAEQEIDNLGALILASGEDWAKSYKKNKDIFAKLIKLEVKMERLIRTYLRTLAKERLANYINWGKYSEKLVTAYRLDVVVDVQQIDDDETDELYKVVHQTFLDGMAMGAAAAEARYNIELGFNTNSELLLKAADKYVGYMVKNVTDHTIDKIKQSINTSLKLSEDQPTAAARLEEIIGDPKRAATIARTEAVRTYSMGVTIFGKEAGYTHKVWELSSDPCDICLLNAGDGTGQIVPIDEDFDSGDSEAPAHPNCVIGRTKISSTAIDAATKRIYKGWIYRIVTAGGNKLTITPNHPILTLDKWIAPSKLNKGDYVISCRSSERVLSAINPDNHHANIVIKKIFKSFRRASGMAASHVPTAAIDFHGDATSKKVTIINTDSILRDSNNAPILKPALHKNLISAYVQPFKHACFGAFHFFFHRVLATPYSPLSRSRIGSILSGGSSNHHESISSGTISNSDPTFIEKSSNSIPADTMLASKLIDRFASDVFADKIISIKRLPFFGHVYNLQTDTSWYIANNIVIHNCRCGLSLTADTDADIIPE